MYMPKEKKERTLKLFFDLVTHKYKYFLNNEYIIKKKNRIVFPHICAYFRKEIMSLILTNRIFFHY